MPTAKPRLMITLEPDRYELLKRMAASQGASMASIVVDLVETVAPVLERVLVAVETAQKAHSDVRDNLRRVAEEAEKATIPHLHAAMGQLDTLVSSIEQAGTQLPLAVDVPASPARGGAEGAARGRAHGSDTPSDGLQDPRPVITGVRLPRKTKKQAGTATSEVRA